MSNFLHGAEVLEASGAPRRPESPGSTAIGLVGTAYGLDHDDLRLVRGLRAARERYAGGGTILPAIEAIYAQGAAPPIAVVQALDPAADLTAVAGEAAAWVPIGDTVQLAHRRVSGVSVTLAPVDVAVVDEEVAWVPVNNVIQLANKPVKPGSVSIETKSGSTPVPADDYEVDEAAGTLTVLDVSVASDKAKVLVDYEWIKSTPVPAGDYEVDEAAGTLAVKAVTTAADAAPVAVSYSYVDAAGVTASEAVAAAARLLDAQSELGVLPEILIAPGFTSAVSRGASNEVTGAPGASGLAAIAERLRGIVVADGPGTTRADALAYRQAIDSRRVLMVDPAVKVADADGTMSEAPASAYGGAQK